MTVEEFRSLATLGADMELRADGDGRTLAGIVVPWDRPTKINDHLEEEFVRGAFGRQLRDPGRIPLAREHLPHGGQLIGKVTMLRDDAKGLYAEARVAATALGEETLALLREGALDHWSIGFREVQNSRSATGVVQRRKATMTELAIVMQGAYGDGAKVGSMRANGERPALIAARAVLEGLPLLPPLPRAMDAHRGG